MPCECSFLCCSEILFSEPIIQCPKKHNNFLGWARCHVCFLGLPNFDPWDCPSCTLTNETDAKVCNACYRKKP